MKSRLAYSVGLIMLLAACGGDKEASPSSSPASSSTVTSTSSTPAPTTTAAPSTTEATTTTTSPPITTTSAAPTTTVPPDPEAAVRQAIQDYFEAYQACGMKPLECDPTSFSVPGSEAQRNLVGFFGEMKGRDLYFSSNERGSYEVVESVDLSPERALLTVCLYDAGVVLGPDGPDAKPTVVNDTISSLRRRYEMQLAEGKWLLARAEDLEALGEEDMCGG